MSVLIKDMEKPKSCYAITDGEAEFCPFVNTDDDCVLLLKKGICESTWEIQYSKCPLVEVLEPCEDAVNRRKLLNDLEELIAAWKKYPVMAKQIKGVETAIEYVKTIPSVTPERKMGKWLDAVLPNDNGGLPVEVCDQCNTFFPLAFTGGGLKFCPNCGADMRGEQDEVD
jgi:hypothetical protein